MVEWKPLNKIVKSISTGLNPRQNFILNEKDASLYYVTVKEITTNKVVFSDSTDRITENAKQIINIRSKLSKGDILFSGIGTIGKVAYVDIPTSNWDCSESVFLIKPNELETKGKYLAYILSSDIAKNQYERGAAGAIMKGVRKVTLESLLIPIPSLSEQTRIVGILDTFTSAIDNLKEQIAQRRKQYEYYRDQLLDLEGKEGVEMKTLPEISDNRDRVRKPITSSKRKAGNYPYYGASGIVDYVDGYIFDGDYLLISEDGANLVARSTPIAFSITGKNWVNNHAHVLQFKDKATQKYVEIYLNMIDLEPWINGAAQPKLNQDNLNKISIPLPPLSEQQRIVSILDTFEASIQNLEAQLKEREKQYEYYRNKLLTFER